MPGENVNKTDVGMQVCTVVLLVSICAKTYIDKSTHSLQFGRLFQMLKTPTSVLVDMEGNFIDFGVSAEDRYQAAVEKNRAACKLSLFRHFKMNLHCKEVRLLRYLLCSIYCRFCFNGNAEYMGNRLGNIVSTCLQFRV